jgi:hypothetical protein
LSNATRERLAMRIVRTPSNKVEGPISDYHVLTYADSGYGPLPHYTKRRVPREQVEELVSRINQRGEAATFFPLPLSAVPRKVIWDKLHWSELRAHLADFLHVNARAFGARRILIDLQSPHGTAHVMEALRGAVEDVSPICVDEIVVVTAAELEETAAAAPAGLPREASVTEAITKDHEARGDASDGNGRTRHRAA